MIVSITRLFASIPSPPINEIRIGSFRITFYGIVIAIGVAVAWRMTMRRYERYGGDPAVAERILLRMVIFGFLGARAAYVSTHLSRFEGEWWRVIAIWEGGLALYGGLTVGLVTLIVFSRRWGADMWLLLDGLAPSVPVAQAFGRWGNYFNQELFGTPSDLPWAVEIDPGRRPAEYAEFATFHPTFLYELLWNLALAGVIVMIERRFPSMRGRLIGLYFIGYGLIRFLLELIRTDTTFRFLGLSRNAWVSMGAMLLGAAVLWWRRNRVPQSSSAG